MARDGALASGEDAQRAVDEAEEFVSDEIDIYRRVVAGGSSSDDELHTAIANDARRCSAMTRNELAAYMIWKSKEIERLTGRKASA